MVYYRQGFVHDTLPFVKHECHQGLFEKPLCVTHCWERVKWHAISSGLWKYKMPQS